MNIEFTPKKLIFVLPIILVGFVVVYAHAPAFEHVEYDVRPNQTGILIHVNITEGVSNDQAFGIWLHNHGYSPDAFCIFGEDAQHRQTIWMNCQTGNIYIGNNYKAGGVLVANQILFRDQLDGTQYFLFVENGTLTVKKQ